MIPSNLEPGERVIDDGGGPRIESAPRSQYPRMLPHDPGPMRPWETGERIVAHVSRHYFDVTARAFAKWSIRRIDVNGRELCSTDDALAYARGLLATAIAETEKTAA